MPLGERGDVRVPVGRVKASRPVSEDRSALRNVLARSATFGSKELRPRSDVVPADVVPADVGEGLLAGRVFAGGLFAAVARAENVLAAEGVLAAGVSSGGGVFAVGATDSAAGAEEELLDEDDAGWSAGAPRGRVGCGDWFTVAAASRDGSIA